MTKVDDSAVEILRLVDMRQKVLQALRSSADKNGIIKSTIGKIAKKIEGQDSISDVREVLYQLRDRDRLKFLYVEYSGEPNDIIEVELLDDAEHR